MTITGAGDGEGEGASGGAGKTNKMGNISEHGERDLWPLSSQESQWIHEGQKGGSIFFLPYANSLHLSEEAK